LKKAPPNLPKGRRKKEGKQLLDFSCFGVLVARFFVNELLKHEFNTFGLIKHPSTSLSLTVTLSGVEGCLHLI
jgi:hypothetical protein